MISYHDATDENGKPKSNPTDIQDLKIKVIDFGLSKILGRKEKIREECGSLGFCAPEIILGKSYNNKVDIWSIGIIIYYMINKDTPFNFKNDNREVAKASCRDELRFPMSIFINVSPQLVDLIKCCLEKVAVNRINIDKLIDHPWLKNFYSNDD